jgi:hypothetical protein
MSNNIAVLQHAMPSYLSTQVVAEELNELEGGVHSAFAVVGVKGKVFSVKFGGENRQILNAQGYPAQYLDVVLVAANAHLTKSYYASTFTDDSNDAPNCWSDDGIVPAATNPVHHVCATCPKNMWGSRPSDNGSKGKACSDTRKLLLVPSSDVANTALNGPMLLRVAPTSLGDLVNYSKKLRQSNVPFYAVVTRLSFDPSVAYPKLQYEAIGYLSEQDFAIVNEMRNSEEARTILSTSYTEAAQPTDTFSTMGAPPAHVAAAPVSELSAPAPHVASVPDVAESATQPRRRPARTTPAAAPAPAPVAQAAPVQEVLVATPAPLQAVVSPKVPAELSNTLAGLFGK